MQSNGLFLMSMFFAIVDLTMLIMMKHEMVCHYKKYEGVMDDAVLDITIDVIIMVFVSLHHLFVSKAGAFLKKLKLFSTGKMGCKRLENMIIHYN